jgi:hypothetical protein
VFAKLKLLKILPYSWAIVLGLNLELALLLVNLWHGVKGQISLTYELGHKVSYQGFGFM